MTTPFPFVAGAVLTAAELNAITTLPINDQTDDYTLVVGDVGKRVIMNKATANTVTVDDSIFAAGDTIFIANKGAGVSTITAGAGVTINSASGLDLVTSQSGQLIALSASSFLFVASDVTASSGVVQVKSTIKTDVFTASLAGNTKTAITGVSVSITPTSASNKILAMVNLAAGVASNSVGQMYTLKRDSTEIAIGDAAGNRQRVTSGTIGEASVEAGGSLISGALSVLDSPATTSAITYSVDISHNGSGTQTVNINRSKSDADQVYEGRGVSTITVMEVTP